MAESIIGLFKSEVIHRRGPWRSLDQVEYAVLEWVDWWNNRRILEPLDYVPPIEYEAAYYRAQTTPSGAAGAQLIAPKYNPSRASGAAEFNWQAEWGSIHMNSMADGLSDPGSPATKDGKVPCASGAICGVMGNPKGSQIGNGIKFDIKNSVLNCLSKPMPNWAFNNPWNSNTTVCIPQYGLHPNYGDGHTLVYQPLWDRRSNDDREWQSGGVVGCQQQISNNCVRDNHECINSGYPDGPGYEHPVSHVFTPEEVADLGGPGTQLPTKYYRYEKATLGTPVVNSPTPPTGLYIDNGKTEDCGDGKTDPKCTKYNYTPITGHRPALSPVYPKDATPGFPITEIDNGTNPHLARLKSYRLTNTDPDEDKLSFVIIDPEDFFDLRLYINGGKYASGYKQFDSKGYVATYDSCPVLGLNNGYSGICDPTGVAGCNLVFCLAADTKITMADGTQREIASIKAGEEVMSFDGRDARNGVLKKAKVVAIAKTKNQEILKIGDLKITPQHKVVLASGRAVMARELRVGDKILEADGLIVTVDKVEADLQPINVYNLVLEKGADGYIANGLRVLSYPKLKGM
jgi:hypothetical protein